MKKISVQTDAVQQAVDLTSKLSSIVESSPWKDGALLVYCRHTTAALMINEGADPDVLHDIFKSLRHQVPEDASYRHAEGNSPAHIRAVMVGNSVMIPLVMGKMALGTWQHVFFMEFDGPRSREVFVQFLGCPEVDDE